MRRHAVLALAGLLLAAALVCGARPALAHPLAPLGLEVSELAGGWQVRLKRPLVQPRGAAFAPRLPDACRAAGPPSIETTDDAVIETTTFDCGALGLAGAELGVDGLGETGLDAVVRVTLPGGRVERALVTAARPRWRVPTEPHPLELAASYLGLGVEHLLTGADHLVFLLGLLFVRSARRRLLAVLTAFTAGHAVTLGLAFALRASMPRAPVEIAIAASIVFVGLEIRHGRPARPVRLAWLTALGFGLVHGLGFAGALADAGMPAHEAPLALASFHVGLELAQLAVVLAVLGVARLCRPLLPTHGFVTRTLPAYAIGGVASMWLVERVWAAAG
ncbi:MAG: HupE/UreJ family protein [Myxococcales bacterium]|nr:HupE/UreJ family protein [Myxococcales bacterium]